jgi:hypothetical protein
VTSGATAAERERPPVWLIAATAVLAAAILAMAVAETSLWMHYLIDGGEMLSLVGLSFILLAGLYLHRRRRLAVSLPLVMPWLLYPVITQGDQIIDNLSINWMRAICQLLLAAIFATPALVLVLAARSALAPLPGVTPRPRAWTGFFPGLGPLARGRLREGSAFLLASILVCEIWIAVRWLGSLMVVTLTLMVLAVLLWGSFPATEMAPSPDAVRRDRVALAVLVAGVVTSLSLFVGYKNRPGAYQGSPSHFMDPEREDAAYRLDHIAVPAGAPLAPATPEHVRAALTAYGRTLETLLTGYYLLDRNYTWHFHNELFLRHTPLVHDYRVVGLARVATAAALRQEADARSSEALSTLPDGDPLRALLTELRVFSDYNFARAPQLEAMTLEFERTKAGLQHAAHLYEGEGKMLSSRFCDILRKHGKVLGEPVVAPVVGELNGIGRSVCAAYANRIVGF